MKRDYIKSLGYRYKPKLTTDQKYTRIGLILVIFALVYFGLPIVTGAW